MRSTLVFVAASLSIALASAACSRQAEGERCSVLAGNDGNDDCQDGLVCTPGTELGGNSDICCPPSGSTHPACIPGALSSSTSSSTATSASSTSSSTSSSASGGGGGAGGTGGEGGSGGAGGGTGGSGGS